MHESTAPAGSVLIEKGSVPAPTPAFDRINIFDRDAAWREYIQRIAARDESGLAALFDESSAIVYGLVVRVLNSQADAEEVASDVYAQVWRSAASYQQTRGSAFSWLAMIARTRAIDRLRSRGLQSYWEQPLLTLGDLRGINPEEAAVQRIDAQRVRGAFDTLPKEQREVVMLAYLSGMSHSEIASKLLIPIGTVKTRIRLGITKLRECIRGAA
jgi:RNA polymerase sigma-70 factor, ECF subfamily